jgi:F1F0 ATPase subunit 2
MIDFGNNLWASSTFSLFIGVLLGAFYFAGLWWTVRQLSTSRYTAPLFLLSMLVRTSVVVMAFYLFLGHDWQQLLLGLVGFFVMRLFATRWVQTKQNGALIPIKLGRKDASSKRGER